jgi:hypothetical protein
MVENPPVVSVAVPLKRILLKQLRCVLPEVGRNDRFFPADTPPARRRAGRS